MPSEPYGFCLNSAGGIYKVILAILISDIHAIDITESPAQWDSSWILAINAKLSKIH